MQGESSQPSAVKSHMVNTEIALAQLVGELEKAQDLAIEVETTGEKAMMANLVGIAISSARGKAFYIPLGHQGLNQPPQLPLTQVATRLKAILENASIGKIAYNGKHVMAVLAGCGVKVGNLNFDPMLAAYLLGEKNLGLKALAFNKLGIEIATPAELTGAGKKQSSLSLLEVNRVADHACASVDILWNLQDRLEAELRKQGLWQLFTEVEMALVPVLVAMEKDGILLDIDLLRGMSLEIGKELLRLEKEIYSSVGHQFNINSPQQLGRVLFEDLRLPQSRRTKTGYSTEASVMEALRGVHPVIEFILEYRQLSKLKSTYVDALPALINHKTGRVHTNFNQTGTATGRLSSSDPNLQNIPIRSEMGNKIRKAIIAPPGAYLLSADYSQIDLRVLAHLSQDPGLIAAFAEDEDIHATTASKLFGIPRDEVTLEMRRNAKTVNFGVIYGMSDYGLEQATNLSREEAAQFIALYFEKYPKVKEYLEATKEQARKLGYVQTVLGRRRFLPEINSANRMVREAAERMAINAPVQGSSADIIKIAMINLHREMERRNLKSKMLLQIHDELLFEVPEAEVEEMKSLVSELMPHAFELRVPVKIDIKLGKNWAEMR
jgi:DNA polymerase-1